MHHRKLIVHLIYLGGISYILLLLLRYDSISIMEVWKASKFGLRSNWSFLTDSINGRISNYYYNLTKNFYNEEIVPLSSTQFWRHFCISTQLLEKSNFFDANKCYFIWCKLIRNFFVDDGPRIHNVRLHCIVNLLLLCCLLLL